MVTNPGKHHSSGPLRSLNLPVPVEVKETETHTPIAVLVDGTLRRVTEINEIWKVQTAWWHPSEVSRRYIRLTLEGDRGLTIFRDMVQGGWYRQRA